MSTQWPRGAEQKNHIPLRGMRRELSRIRKPFLAALSHDVLGSAKAAAYSAILCLFPALLVITTLLALTPAARPLRDELITSFAEILPSDTMLMLQASFHSENVHSGQVVFSAGLVSLWAAMGVMLSLMQGFRRAYNLPRDEWPFWKERLVALALIPSCLAPMVFASMIVAFGHQIELWVIENADHVLKFYVLLLWRIIRLAIGLLTNICVLVVIYHFGTPRRRQWQHVIAGACGAAGMWLAATLLYGFYVTRFSNYSLFYGSLGTVVATLVWLYITWLSVLLGAEVNAQFFPKPAKQPSPSAPIEENDYASSTPARIF